ncbi:MAG: tyrosine-type recombinase/integrase [Hungatella sp.]|nr:tyrosine-type recombinase/integrase [Hungatella sp.]
MLLMTFGLILRQAMCMMLLRGMQSRILRLGGSGYGKRMKLGYGWGGVVAGVPFRQSTFPIAQRENAQRSPTTPPLFPLHSRKSILAETERYLKRVILEKYAQRQGVATKSTHKMRKTFASNLNANGVPLDCIRELLGHSSLSTTVYSL